MVDKLSYTGTIIDASRHDAVTPETNQSAWQFPHEDVRALLRNASVPMEFKQLVQNIMPDPLLTSFTSPGELVTGDNTCLENAPSEMKLCQDPAGLSATPEYVPQSFYLTDAMINLSQIKHATAGLQCFDTRPLSALITNTFFLEPCFYPPVYWCPCPDDEKEITVCVRFFVVDACDDEGRTAARKNILKDVDYSKGNAAHLGTLGSSVVGAIEKSLDYANEIWRQAAIKFVLDTNADDANTKFAYALDIKNLSYTDIFGFDFVFRNSVNDMARSIEIQYSKSIKLCQCFDGGKGRGITTKKKGYKEVQVTYGDIKWPSNSPYKQSGDPKNFMKPSLDLEENKDKKAAMKRLLENATFSRDEDILSLMGETVDRLHGARCINVFIIAAFEDKDIKGDQAGLGGGNNIFIEDAYITGSKNKLLSHELGHTLGLYHQRPDTKADEPKNNLMHPTSNGIDLRKKDQFPIARARAVAVAKRG